jgi:hypothetical protein
MEAKGLTGLCAAPTKRMQSCLAAGAPTDQQEIEDTKKIFRQSDVQISVTISVIRGRDIAVGIVVL